MDKYSAKLCNITQKKIIYCLVTFILILLTACGGGSNGGGSTSSQFILASAPTSSSIFFQVSSSQQNTSSESSSQFDSSSSSKSEQNIDIAILLVNDKTIEGPLLDIGYFPETIEPEELISIYAVAYSAEGVIDNIVWQQITGPIVELTPSNKHLEIRTGQAGGVVIQGTVTDAKGISVSQNIAFTVTSHFSEIAELKSGNSYGEGIDLVIIGDGFLAEDQTKFKQAAEESINYLFSYDSNRLQPYRPLFNIWVIPSISTTRDISNANQPGYTLLGSYFNCGNIARLLCADTYKATQFVSTHVPQYDQALILVNSDRYGGSGGVIGTASLNSLSKDIVIHELGHSIAGLADEYSENDSQFLTPDEPIEPNITVNKNPKTVKWNYWYKDINRIAGVDTFVYNNEDVGYFEGGQYQATGIWRPLVSSIMRELQGPFGAVNSEAWATSIWHYYEKSHLVRPQLNTLTNSLEPVVFSVHPPMNINNLQIHWWINDVLVEGNNNAYFLILSQIDESIQSVRVEMKDATGLIRRDPNNNSKIEYLWKKE